MWEYNYISPPLSKELYHYGVLGMKWGRRRAQHKQKANVTLAKRALNYDIRSDKMNRKSEKRHAIDDLGGANKNAKRAANYSIKSEKLKKKANKADNDFKRTMLERRSESMAYKSTKARMKANRISKTKGYGVKAMQYSIKSDKLAIRAAAARKQIASNKAYIARMDRKLSALTPEERSRLNESLFNTGLISSVKDGITALKHK